MPFRLTLAVVVLAQLLSFAGRASGQEGWGIVVEPAGGVVFTDVPSETVWRLLPGGGREKIALGKRTRTLVLGGDGRLYGSEPAPDAAVWRIDRDGGLSFVVPPSTNLPMDLAAFTLDRQGALWSTSAGSGTVLLQRRGPDGTMETVAGGGRGHADGQGEAAKFEGIDGMAWGPEGLLHVADGPYVRTVSRDGRVATLAGGRITEVREGEEDLLGLAVTADGIVYAADAGGHRVLQIPRGGQARTLLATGRFWAPAGVAVAGRDLYVLEHLSGPLAFAADLEVGPYLRVRRIAPSGDATVLTTLWGGNTVAGAGGLALLFLFLFFLVRRRRRNRYGSAGRRLRL